MRMRMVRVRGGSEARHWWEWEGTDMTGGGRHGRDCGCHCDMHDVGVGVAVAVAVHVLVCDMAWDEDVHAWSGARPGRAGSRLAVTDVV